ncbi:MAG: PIN domain-containing protein [Gammaproteobacteria bacterium]
MAIALLDTNILIDIANGVEAARDEVLYYSDVAISNITYIEFVVGLRARLQSGRFKVPEFDLQMTLVRRLQKIDITDRIADAAIDLRCGSLLGGPRIKLPDAIICATAIVTGRYMVTRDPRGFTGPNIRIPYQIDSQGRVVDIAPPV